MASLLDVPWTAKSFDADDFGCGAFGLVYQDPLAEPPAHKRFDDEIDHVQYEWLDVTLYRGTSSVLVVKLLTAEMEQEKLDCEFQLGRWLVESCSNTAKTLCELFGDS